MNIKRKIMVIEDNEINRTLLSACLCDRYTVIEAENGLVALELLKTYKNDIALILLDVVMPVMDGYTFLDKIRQDRELALIPVIVTTQNDSEQDEIAALEHGATEFVPKPYRPQIILHRISNLITLRENAAMINQLRYDRLTGLYSKEFFCQKVQEQLLTHPELKHTIICSDIENFKLYNDVFGITEGDSLLKQMAEIFRSIAGADGICGRFGSDRFLLFRSSNPDDVSDSFIENAKAEMKKLKTAIVKWGVYEIEDNTLSAEIMCDRAVLAANSIKGQYNCQFAVYDDNIRSKLIREQLITESMEKAISENQFEVWLQPKYTMKNDCLGGAEALVRWTHPELGFLSPGEFIPLFEKNGFITRLDEYVWERVCEMLHRWKKQGMPIVPVSVNVSRADIYNANIFDILCRLVEKYELDPSLLHLEITESAYTEHPNKILAVVERLREYGFVIELDDFGSGYSSLNLLNRMKLDILKLDMKFIQSETAKSTEQGILSFIVKLAHHLKLLVVAEGVETEEQTEHIREIGCDYVQGYFFAKPMPSNEFEKYLTGKSVKD